MEERERKRKVEQGQKGEMRRKEDKKKVKKELRDKKGENKNT